ncbi:cellulose biosynthesis protein CelD [Lentzea sp. NBRC 105346]|uniref:GNAT family N-acetyltransferase n=1 Tax=Lentzea sp. NBRC 105346 TaxID=3032205 RepID=UPI0024A14D0F|nr:GNAT family N-acetyltransferase [Lentzea sp. NBRC 105346]GLZ28880.1 cellulose biosynthesis protein CelD [Lentzea sp. NBRC 105346]
MRIPFNELTSEQLDTWHSLRDNDSALDSPYFHPAFAAAVHDSGTPVEVVTNGTAFFPVHRTGRVLRPVGWPGADFQAPIGSPFLPTDLLTGGIRSFEFDHLLDLPEFAPFVTSRRASPFLDVTGGLEGYLGRASKSGKENMGQARRRTAKAEREIGPIRFVAESLSGDDLARVIGLKRAQYAVTGAVDYFAAPGRRELLTRLLHTRKGSFGGVLSTLHAGDRLVAAHFGLRSGKVLHWWFPVYDPEFSSYAPGWMLLRELVLASGDMGFTRIDLGRGDDEYKRRAKTGETTVCQGMVTRSSALLRLRRTRESALAKVKSSPLAPALRGIVRKFR